MLHPIQRNENTADAGTHLKRVPEENGLMIESISSRRLQLRIGSNLGEEGAERGIDSLHRSGGRATEIGSNGAREKLFLFLLNPSPFLDQKNFLPPFCNDKSMLSSVTNEVGGGKKNTSEHCSLALLYIFFRKSNKL